MDTIKCMEFVVSLVSSGNPSNFQNIIQARCGGRIICLGLEGGKNKEN